MHDINSCFILPVCELTQQKTSLVIRNGRILKDQRKCEDNTSRTKNLFLFFCIDEENSIVLWLGSWLYTDSDNFFSFYYELFFCYGLLWFLCLLPLTVIFLSAIFNWSFCLLWVTVTVIFLSATFVLSATFNCDLFVCYL